jgi:uncharacterized membrane protein
MASTEMASTDASHGERPAPDNPDTTLARGLGWFSLALGVTELAVPRTLARVIGVEPSRRSSTVLRLFGARELLTGLGVLAQPRRAPALWLRVAGDAVDLAAFGMAARARSSTARLVGAALAVAGVTAIDLWAARRTGQARATAPVTYAVTVNKTPEETYAFWRKLAQLPLFMDYLESVTERGDTSHWVAKLPAGGTVEWDAKLTQDRPGKLIAWQSVAGSPIATRGRVTFTKAPGRDMTEVRVELQLGIAGSAPSAALAKLFAKPEVKGDLRRFKAVIETGEVLYSDATQHALPHPAQPSKPGEGARPQVFIPPPPTAVKGVTR